MRKMQIAAVLLIAGWAGLYFSSHGLLVWSAREQVSVAELGPLALHADTLRCSYFVATGFRTLDYSYGADQGAGRSVCPRLRDFSE